MGNQILKQLITVSPGSTMTGLYWSQVRTNMDGFCSTVDVANLSEVFGQNYGSGSHLGHLSIPKTQPPRRERGEGLARGCRGRLTSGRRYLHHRT